MALQTAPQRFVPAPSLALPARASRQQEPERPWLALLFVACVALALGGAATELWRAPAAAWPAEAPDDPAPLAQHPSAALLAALSGPDSSAGPDAAHAVETPDAAEALLARVGPSIPPAVRAQLAAALLDESRRAALDPVFLLALIGVESRYRLAAESARGARGLGQLMPSTFAWVAAREPDVGAEDLESGEDPVADLRLAARYYHYLEQRFADRKTALIAYNAGPRNALRALRDGEVPPHWRAYPRLVGREYERLQRLLEGEKPEPTNLVAALDGPGSRRPESRQRAE